MGGENIKSIFEITQLIAKRSEMILKQKLEIIRPTTGITDTVTTLNYFIDKLKTTNLKLNGDINTEIDSTLLNCKKWFVQDSTN